MLWRHGPVLPELVVPLRHLVRSPNSLVHPALYPTIAQPETLPTFLRIKLETVVASRGKIAAFAYPREMTGKEYTGCVIYCCCSDLACCLGMLTRVEVRRRFSIQGDMCQVRATRYTHFH